MSCPACGFDNPEGMKFCGNCAEPLHIHAACASCGFENPPGFKFCGECAAPLRAGAQRAAAPAPPERDPRAYTPAHLADKILQSKSALEGERKRVTVLFADVKGSVELSEQVDPEEWHAVLDRFFSILGEGVHRFEGTINQYTGDGVMALFGAPIAHEDHAQRACYAALRLSEELGRFNQELKREKGISLLVRTGLNSGEVVVGKIGDDLRMDYTAQGHTVGLAARMQQIADPGKVYLTEHTAELVSGYFDLVDLGEFDIKGASERVRVHELGGVGVLRTRLDMSRSRGLSKFVGRADEMAALQAAIERAQAGTGQVVGVVGEAGLGKSRLSAEFLERCRGRGVTTYETHGVAHGKGIPFLPMLHLFRTFFGIRDEDGPATAREKIAGRLLLLDETFRDALPLLFDFLGVPDPERPPPAMDASARQRQLLGVVKGVVEARGAREMTVTLLEDLHWFDPGSEEFLAQLVDALAATRSIIITNFRPEFQASWMRKSYYQQISLVPLGAEGIGELLDHLLGRDPSVAPVASLIQDRTGGNPFFVEEAVQALAESGSLEGSKGAYRLVHAVEELQVPNSVQALLDARIDRLPEREKHVLQTASVIGRKFSEPILRAVVELPESELLAALSALQGAEFIFEDALYPVAEYSFKHPLTQQVAQQSQLAGRRERTHAAVAKAIETLEPEKLDERAALIAFHWEGAGDMDRASQWHRRAAEWIGFSNANEALRHWKQVRDLLDGLEQTPAVMARASEARSQVLWIQIRLGASDEEARSLFTEARELALRSGDRPALARVLWSYGVYNLYAGGSVDRALELLIPAVETADESDDDDLRMATRFGLNLAQYFGGRLVEARATAEEAVAIGAGDVHVGMEILGYSGLLFMKGMLGAELAYQGHWREAEALLEDAIVLDARAGGTANVTAGLGRSFWSIHGLLTGAVPTALAHIQQGVERVAEVQTPAGEVFIMRQLGIMYAVDGQWDRAAQALDRSHQVLRERRTFRQAEGELLAWRALVHLEQGEPDQAEAVVEQAREVCRATGARLEAVMAEILRARILRRTRGAKARQEVEPALEAGLALAREVGSRLHEVWILEECGALAQAVGDAAACGQHLGEAERLYREMDLPEQAERIHGLLQADR